MKTRLTLVVLLLLTLLVTACQPQGAPVPQDPLEAVKTIADKQKEVKTQHMDMTMALQSQARRLDRRCRAERRDVQEFQGQCQPQRRRRQRQGRFRPEGRPRSWPAHRVARAGRRQAHV